MTKREFGGLIKSSYRPDYDHIDDLQLAEDTLEQYPFLANQPENWAAIASRIHELATIDVENRGIIEGWLNKHSRKRQAEDLAFRAKSAESLAAIASHAEAAKLGISAATLNQLALDKLRLQAMLAIEAIKGQAAVALENAKSEGAIRLEEAKARTLIQLEETKVTLAILMKEKELELKYEELRRSMEVDLADAENQRRIRQVRRG